MPESVRIALIWPVRWRWPQPAGVDGLALPVLAGAPVMSSFDAPEPGESEDPGFLVLGGELHATVLTSVRREQLKLRAKLLVIPRQLITRCAAAQRPSTACAARTSVRTRPSARSR